MGLTRTMLRGMGLNDEQIGTIIEAHTEVTDALKSDLTAAKDAAKELKAVQKELNTLKESGGNWQEKFEKEHKAFEDFRADVDAKASRAAKETAYREALAAAGVSEKRVNSILKIANLDAVELDADGKAKDANGLAESCKAEWADFIVQQQQTGAPVATPPTGVKAGTMTRDEIMAIKNTEERHAAIKANPEAFSR